MHLYRHIVWLLLLLATFIRCSQNMPKTETEKERIFQGYHIALDSIIRTPKGIIRGVELGATMNEVKRSEVVNITEADETYYYYEFKADSITTYSLTYSFIQDSLEEIELQVNCRNPDTGAVILNDIKNYYQKKYTAPVMDKGIYVYNCFDSRKRNFSINLSDNSGIDNSVINLLIYREK